MTEQDLYFLLKATSKAKPTSPPCPTTLTVVQFAPLEAKLGEGHGFAMVKLSFYPTAFMFHGKDVLYPSPQRLAYSLAKTYWELFGVDLKHLADRAPTALEVVGMRVKRVGVNIGDMRVVPAFMGKAKLAIYGNVEAWLSLLKLGEAVGVGISRAIGFGKYKIEQVQTNA
ncbi:MAG: CRISPR system precrRNA processing endoribonuclease RAMP protein Cas6 [Pyrobaculum sp.]